VRRVHSLLALGSALTLAAIRPVAAETCPSDFPIVEATVATLQQAQASGQISARCLVELYLERIDRYDRNGPQLHSVLELNPDAEAIAATLDAERAAGQVRGPLHGIPVLIKGNVGTLDRMTTTAGALALQGSVPASDAFIVQRLRAAGAVILGKANLTEFANFVSFTMPSGYSTLGGQTLNPYNPTLNANGLPVLTPCGSSAGSGAAIAANLAAVSVGTETSGSILCPSNFNSLVGIKTTLGLVSRTGIIPLALSQDVAGPMARTVADAAALLDALAGYDPADPVTRRSLGRIPPTYTAFLNAGALAGARIGIARQYFGGNAETNALIEQAIAVLRAQGATIVDPANVPTFEAIASDSSSVLIYEFKQNLNNYLAGLPNPLVKTLDDIVRFNRRNREAIRYGQSILISSNVQSGNTITFAEATRDRAEDLALARGGLDALFARENLDALLFPTSAGAGIGARAGYPTVIVPAGYLTSGQPVGISLLGRAFSEPRLIELAYAYEQASRLRRPPAATP
jgi:amidase